MKDIKVFLKKKTKKKQQYGRQRHKNLPEDEKQKLDRYSKNYCKIRKNTLLYLWKIFSFRKSGLLSANILKSNDLES